MHKLLPLLVVMIVGYSMSVAQCPTGADLCKAVDDSRKNPDADNKDLIAMLLRLEQRARNCRIAVDSGLVSLHQRLAALYFNSDNYPEAARFIGMSLHEYDLAPSKQQRYFKGRILFTQGMIYKSLPDVGKAVAALDSAVYYLEQYPQPGPPLVLSYKNLSNLQFQLGDYARSLFMAERSVAEAKVQGDSIYESLARIERAMSLHALGRHAEALVEIKAADALTITAGYPDVERANLYSVRAGIERSLKQFSGALQWYQQCLRLYHKSGSRYGQLLATNNIGDIYLNDLSNAAQAIPYFQKALSFAESSYDSLRVYSNLGDSRQAMNDRQRALQFYQLGLRCLFPRVSSDPSTNPTMSELASTPNLEYVFTLITNKSICWSTNASANPSAAFYALNGYHLADKLVDALSWATFMSDSKIFWRSKTHELYEHAIEACEAMSDLEGAFYFFEKSRAVLLTERMNESNLLARSNRRLMTELAALRKAMNRYRDQLPAKNVSNPAQDREYLQLQDGYETLVASIRKSNPYVFSTLIDTAATSLTSIKNLLAANGQELIETFVGDSSVYVLHVSPLQTKLQRISSTEYQALLEKYLGYCRDEELLNRDYGGFCSTSTKLTRLLLGTFSFKAKRLVVSPDGMFFPFEALKLSDNVAANDFLLHEFATSYVYAARSIQSGQQKITASAGFLGIAPVHFDNRYHLAELGGSDVSLESISNMMGEKKLLLHAQASRANFLEQFGRYECLQLYTHAADSSARNEPVIYLSDSLLYLSDLVADGDMRTRLVVLSACETGVGKWSKGEGVFSFNRGFAELGIPATVSTLWPIDNQSMYGITELFYKYLSQGMNKDEALQQARLSFIEHADGVRKLPFNWAAAVLIGDTAPLSFENGHKKTIIALAAMIVLLGAVIIYLLQRRNSFRATIAND